MRLAGAAVGVAVVVALAGCTSSGSSPAPASSPTPTPVAVSVPGCPHHVPGHVRNAAAPDHRLVWPGPVAMRLCRYYPTMGLVGRRVPHGTLYGHAGVGVAAARPFAVTLDHIPRPRAGERIACPAAFGTHDVLYFGYADGRTLQVIATPDGCPSFSNGSYATGDFSPAFERYMRLVTRLVPTKQQPAGKAARSPKP